MEAINSDNENESNMFDVILSGRYDEISNDPDEIRKYLPRLAFTAEQHEIKLYKKIYQFPELNRIRHYYQINGALLRDYLKKTLKANPIENALSHPPSTDQIQYNLNKFENGTPIEHFSMVAELLYKLWRLFNFEIEINEEEGEIIEHSDPNSESEANKKREKDSKKKEERTRKKVIIFKQKRKIKRKQEATTHFTILFSPAYYHLIKEIVPIVPLVIPAIPNSDLPSLSIPVFFLPILFLIGHNEIERGSFF